ncbi:FadR/GntR family transcriptional regulator [Pseudonocardia benzenivorans]|uniref:GntR domain protein n=2 Tax=Pseudonocardia TaxID=1847 RepID=F4CL24_PSEUX|nr:FCD domain-containing protein [Pseudonocardia dioxanivorans]AEA24953.1 GntR domain protein [Pseudonocardia dioxanivorans CB1190]GJF01823.1 GntR family transcriptional regulator [Pseudonocardia sp. D17]
MTAEDSAGNGAGSPVGRQLRVPKMAELVAGHLRRQIIRGELAAGDALPSEAALMEQFQVSRPTLREAFRVLESESLISVRRGAHGGARVQVPDADVAARYAGFILEYRGTTLEDVYDARLVLEPPCVALLAERRTEQDVARLREALTAHDAVRDDHDRTIRTHMAFHTLLTELTRNQTLQVLIGMIDHIIALANWSHVSSDAGTPAHLRAIRRGLRAHHLVVDYIEARDAVAAEALWRKHLEEARDYLLRADVRTVLDLLG